MYKIHIKYINYVKFTYIVKTIKIDKLIYAGHIVRRKNDEFLKRIMMSKPEGGRKREKSKRRLLAIITWRKCGIEEI